MNDFVDSSPMQYYSTIVVITLVKILVQKLEIQTSFVALLKKGEYSGLNQLQSNSWR